MRNPTSVVCVVLLIVAVAPLGAQTSPATAPISAPGVRDVWRPTGIDATAKLTTVGPADNLLIPASVTTDSDLEIALAAVPTSPSGEPFELGSPSVSLFRPDAKDSAKITIPYSPTTETPPTDIAAQVVKYVETELQHQIAKTASLTSEQRVTLVEQLSAKAKAVEARSMALRLLTDVKADRASLLREKLQQLRAEAQRLQFDRDSKQARRQALTRELKEQEQLAAIARQNDAIAAEMKKLVDLRAEALKKLQASFNAGVTNPSEVDDAEAALAEAKIRLAERQASLGKSGEGELIDRLTDELAMISVDSTDLELRLHEMEAELKKYDPATMDAATLDKLMAEEPALAGLSDRKGANQMRVKLVDEAREIQRQRFATETTGITLTPTD